ncbi:TPA: beta-phosphoglucomutase [Streptococcus suis]
MFKGALFDLDGVIADTAAFHFSAWKNLIRKYFQTELPDKLEEKTKGVSREDSLKIILDYLDITVSADCFNELCNEKNQTYIEALGVLNSENILPGILELITKLRSSGIKLALASASKNGPFILEKLGLSDAFDVIADPEKVTKGKPAPDIFLIAAAGLGLSPSDCIGFEDSVAGVTAINAAGIYSVAIGGKELDHANIRFHTTACINLPEIISNWERQSK